MFAPLTPEDLLAPRNGLALLAAVSLGGLVGLVRQWNEKNRAVAGVRTFALWSAFGFVAMQLERAGIAWALIAGLAVTASLLVSAGMRPAKENPPGLTTMSSGILTYVCGAMLGAGLTHYAVGLAIIVAVIVGIRHLTVAWSGHLTETDVRAGLQFAFISGVILPLVPNEKLWGVFNPYDTWRMVLLVSGVNLVGYAAMRLLGERAGAAVTGIVGGLASSTAVTLAFARRSREQPDHGAAHAQAVLLACGVMVPRVLIILFALHPALAGALTLPGLAVLAATLIIPLRIHFSPHDRAEGAVPAVGNPLNLGQSVKFALLYALIVFLLDASRDVAGAGGLYAVSFISGLTDMDAIALSLAGRTGAGELATATAATAILLAMGANTLVKLSLAVTLGAGKFRKLVGCGLALPLTVAGTAIVIALLH